MGELSIAQTFHLHILHIITDYPLTQSTFGGRCLGFSGASLARQPVE